MTTFKDLGLNPMILQALTEIGFETPTPIQSQAIPHLINSDKDLVALAQTGTGKTAAFSLPIIQQLDLNDKSVQTLILCPTRELALQITSDVEKFVKYFPGVSALAVYGGDSLEKQMRALKRNPQIVVGTPGRVHDMIRRRALKVESVKWLVLDEADEMLNMGFKEELDEILKTMPEQKQVLLFSATMSSQVRRIASNYMKSPEEITVGEKNKGADSIQHFYYVVHEKDRYQTLRRIADVNPDIHALVFCRTRRETQQVADKLIQDHYSAEAIHGDISQDQRTNVMNRFRDKKIQLLVATDVAARGIDVSGLTHVINYNLPESGEAYVHRSGRTGRAHNTGISIVIVNMREKFQVRDLERRVGKSFEKGRIPTGDDICEKQLFNLIETVCNVDVNEDQIGKYINVINKKFEHLDRDQLIKKLVSVEFNRFIEHYKNADDLNANINREDRFESEKSSMLFGRFKINIGRDMGLNVKELLAFINDKPDLKRAEIGSIDIKNSYTLFEVDEKLMSNVLAAFNNVEVGGVMVTATCEQTGIKSTRGTSKPKGGFRGGSGGPRRDNYSGGGGGRRDSYGGGKKDSRGGSSRNEGKKRRF